MERLLTFVVIGGGPTGVELAGAIAEIAFKTLTTDFRHIDTTGSRVVLVEALDDVLPPYPEPLREKARRQLEGLGVEVRLGEPVETVDEDGVDVGGERIRAATVLWAAGVEASPLGAETGAETDRAGRVRVEPDLSVAAHPNVLVCGDLAHVEQDGEQVPGVAQGALQMGRHAADVIRADRAGRSRPEFHYDDKGSMATIGRSRAVADLGRLRFGGFFAWLLWVFVHLLFLVGHRNRLVVLLTWAWAWLTFQRSGRLIWRASPERAGDPTDRHAEEQARAQGSTSDA